MMKNDILKTLTYPGVDLNELIERQAGQQTGTVPSCSHTNNASSSKAEAPKVYKKSKHCVVYKKK